MSNVLVIPQVGASGALGVPYGTLDEYENVQSDYSQVSDVVIPDPGPVGPVPAYIPFPTNIPYQSTPPPDLDGCQGFCFIVWIDENGNFFRGETGPCPPTIFSTDAAGNDYTIDEWALAVIQGLPVGVNGGSICLDQFGDIEIGFGGECPPGAAPPVGFLIYCEETDEIIDIGPGGAFVTWIPPTPVTVPPRAYPFPCPCLVNKVIV